MTPPRPATGSTKKTKKTKKTGARRRASRERTVELDPRRVCVEAVSPEVDGGRFPVKRVTGESVVVEADVFAEGHDVVACAVLFRADDDGDWSETSMTALGNDRWRASFTVDRLGAYRYTVEGWTDAFETWRRDFEKRLAAGTQTEADLRIGAELVESARDRADGDDAARLEDWSRRLTESGGEPLPETVALDPDLATLMRRYPDRARATRYRELAVTVERTRARHGAWYELFPRSCAPEPGRHGSLRDCADRLDYVASMGFDIVYLPPIHPIGVTNRKGRNNAVVADESDVGSPWAIGAAEGGHTAVHPALGTLDDFDALIASARERHLEVALDIAFQCTPDHPWVEAHPGWFRHRPDGTIQYAENPPKKYQDIYPLEFDNDDWKGLWRALRDVFLFWARRGVHIFRVDNPHTKPLRFWEWVIAEVRRAHPDTVFLSEAFTRPKVMYQLAKAGFSQSYTYFTWRNSRSELTDYFTELDTTGVREFFRPNLWPNTPDILPEYLQYGGRPAFVTRVVLASMLGANYGIYGPAFELCENQAREPGSEEYLHSEKYEIRYRNLDREWTLRPLITRLNQARRDNPALQTDEGLCFHPTDNDLLLCFSKTTADRSNTVVVVANLDYSFTQAGWVTLDLTALGLDDDDTYQMHDLLSDARYLWSGRRNYVELDPHVLPAHVFRVRRRHRTERDFDYFL